MSTAGYQVLALAGAATGLTLVSLALWGSRRAWRRHHNPMDMALGVAALVWLIHLLVTTSLTFAGSKLFSAYVTHAGYQALIVSVAFFLLTSAGMTSTGIYLMLAVQAVAGGVALHWYHWGGSAQSQAYQAWIAINLLFTILLMVVCAYRVYLTRSYQCWLVLSGGIIGLGLGVNDLLLADDAWHTSTLFHCFYAAFLLVIWHLMKQRVGSPASGFITASDFQHSTDFEPVTGFGPVQDVATSAVANERRRIAQDLHDGVASRITSILSSLDVRTPQQQAVALELEQCLVDLQMTVDAIDSANSNVLEALGRLRYRVQHPLDKLGISMAWKVEICGEIEAVRGEQAQQVFFIAQECLSNVMRHAHASAVEVVCRFVPETRRMVLEVRDNGQGIARGSIGRRAGKGLEGMRRRAQAMGGELLISSKTGMGTRVRLTLPLAENEALSPSRASSDGAFITSAY